jgi:hypothetical protein
MAYVIGCLMAGLSFLLNKLLLKCIGIKVIVTYSPILEEVTKTLCPYYFGADILVTHMIFGILEAAYDWFRSRSGRRGTIAALLSMIGHSLFGVVTISIFSLSGSVFVGVFVGICTHLIWNVAFIRLAD